MKDAIMSRLEKVKGPDRQGEYTSLCPFPDHKDTNPSFSVNFDKGVYKCFGCGSGGPISRLAMVLGIAPTKFTPRAERHAEVTYDYASADGRLLFQVVRSLPKSFRQRRPDGAGGWVHDLEGVVRVLYHLPDVIEAVGKGETVYVTEGEKDADNLRRLGLVSTTNPMGAGKWRPEYSETLAKANVVILPDNDDAGRNHALQVAQSLRGKAASVKVVNLPGLLNKGDVSDWLETGGTRQLLEALVAAPLDKESPSGDEVLDELVTFIRRFVVLTREQADAVALWIAHTHLLDFAEATPYLHVTSAEKRSGKTRLLEVAELLVEKPWLTGRVTPAVLARKVDAECPTLLLDESDAAFSGDREYAETLRGILNTGHRRGGKCSVCVGQGASINYRDLSTFCPKAIAGIGKIPDTVADRSVAIVLKRRNNTERVERFRHRKAESEAASLREHLSAWAESLQVPDAEPSIPGELDDRAIDGWEPLLSIADAAGGDWPQRAREAAVTLSGSGRDDTSLGVRLLIDIRAVFSNRAVERLRSAELVQALIAEEESPWPDLDRRPLDATRLARLLRPYGIAPKTIRFDETSTAKGYDRAWFADAWERYVPTSSHGLAVTPVTLSTVDACALTRNSSSETEGDVTLPHNEELMLDVTPVTATWGLGGNPVGRRVREVI